MQRTRTPVPTPSPDCYRRMCQVVTEDGSGRREYMGRLISWGPGTAVLLITRPARLAGEMISIDLGVVVSWQPAA